MAAKIESPLVSLNPRRKLGTVEIRMLIDEMKFSLQGAQSENYFVRMMLNHDTRYAWWEGQSTDGRKWSKPDNGRLYPGQQPTRDVFPHEGASDARIRLVETVIREHNRLKRLALQRKHQQVGPRNLSPDDDPQAMAALWGQADEYYQDITVREQRTALAQWADIGHEYGAGFLYVGWKSDTRLDKRQLTMQQVQDAITAVALQVANENVQAQWLSEGGDPAEVPELDGEQQHLITMDASMKLQEMMLDEKQNKDLALALQRLDEEMPLDEARRLARSLEWDSAEPVSYYAVTLTNQRPDYRALTYGVDFFFNPSDGRIRDSGWCAMLEWVDIAELRSRVNNPHEPYNEAWVTKVEAFKGQRAFAFDNLIEGGKCPEWVLACGRVRSGLAGDKQDAARAGKVQLLHVYHIATTFGNAKAVYHTILSGHISDSACLSQCCEHADGRLPFFETLNDIEALTMLASEGYGEKCFTDQTDVKTQRDYQADNASYQIKPPILVPISLSGGKIPMRPGLQIPYRNTAGMGKIEKLEIGQRANESQNLEAAIRLGFDEYWARGMQVDPVTKQTAQQVLVSDYLMDVQAVKVWTFKLIQQFAPEEVRVGFMGGLSVNVNLTRKAIQGEVGVQLDFDVNDLDGGMVEKKMKTLPILQALNTRGELNLNPMLKAVTASLFPAHYRLLVADSDARAQEETQDEQDIVGRILQGTLFNERGSYVEGTNHELRLQVMQQIFGAQTDAKGVITQLQPNGPDGQLSRAQRLFETDPEVNALVVNRLKFHARQLQQQENAVTGRNLVQTVDEG